MTRMRLRCADVCLVAACLFVGGLANAQDRDRVTVKYMPAPMRLGAYEPMEIQFERFNSADPSAATRRADRFFDEIGQILAAHGIDSNWQFVLPDGAYIRINIQLGARHIELSSAHTLYERGGRFIATERGLVSLDGRDPKQVLAKESEAFRSRRLAFEKILALVSAKVRGNLGQ